MASENIGGVSVLIGGDYSPLIRDFAQAQSLAARAGAGVAAAFTAGGSAAGQSTGLVDQYGRAIQSVAGAQEVLAPATNQSTQAIIRQNAALHGSVTEIQAVSGTLRALDGNGGIRAAERFLTMIPGLGAALQVAFPVVGLIALGEVVARTFTKFNELSEAEKNLAEVTHRNDIEWERLASDFENIRIEQITAEFGKLAGLNLKGFFQAGDLQDQGQAIAALTSKIAEANRTLNETQALYSNNPFKRLLQDWNPLLIGQRIGEVISVGTTNTQIANIKALEDELDKLNEKAFVGNAGAQKDATLRQKQAAEDAVKAAREEEEANARTLRAHIEAVERGIQAGERERTFLRNITEEYDRVAKAAEAEADRRVAAAARAARGAERADDEASRMAERGAEEQRKQAAARKAIIENVEKRDQEASREGERQASERERVLKSVGITGSGEEAKARVAELQDLLIREQAITGTEREQLALKRAILQTQISMKSNQAGVSFGEISSAGKQLPGALGGALAKGIVDGKGIGKDIRESLRGIGQEMLGSVFKELIGSLLLNSAAHGTLTLATIGNTVATEANTIWLAIKSIFGFAGGTDFAPGGMAVVGERGPEVVNLPRGSQVIPNHMLKGYADGAGIPADGGDTHFHVSEAHFHGVQNVQQMAEAIYREVPRIAKNRTSKQSPFAR